MKKTGKATMHVLSHTHWDREWYQDFQGYRRRLVHLVDNLLDLLEARPEYRYFHMDGQTACLDDYLAVRPEERKRLEGHIRSGRILVGPWFVMPDERLLSGESLVRNLVLGHRLSREYGGKPMPVGYVTDIFGHCSQLPQILKGFHIDAAFFHRGLSCANENSEMVWQGADGTETLIIKVYQYWGYGDFLAMREWNEEELALYEKRKLGLATTDVLFGLDGNDHRPALWDIPEEIKRVNGALKRIRCVHSSIPRYLAALKKAMGSNWTKGRKRFKGELNTPAKTGQYSQVMNAIGSSRPYLKQANDAQEYLLSRVAEPFHAWAVSQGAPSQKSFLDLAWRYLLLNHPHDSIVGCSIDQVHRDMIYRFDQSRLLAENVVWESLQAVVGGTEPESPGEAVKTVTAFNPRTVDAGPVAKFSFEVASPVANAREAEGLKPVLADAGGEALACEVLSVKRGTRALPFMHKTRADGISPVYRPTGIGPVDRFHVAAAASVPALGCRTWRIEWRKPEPRRNTLSNKGLRKVKADAASRTIDNGLVRLTVAEDGSVSLYDKETRTRYNGLHVFEDAGDSGEGWNHRYPAGDVAVLSTDAAARGRVSVSADGKNTFSASLTVSFTLKVPHDLADATGSSEESGTRAMARTKKLTPLDIETTFTLDAGSRRVSCRTEVRNTACCHRLRVLFPSGCKTNAWFGDSAFDVVKRNVKLRDTSTWLEQGRPEQVIKNFAAVLDGRRGLAVLTKGLCEAAVLDDSERTLALTLFRSFREQLAWEVTQDSLLLGKVTSEYALMPLAAARGVPAALLMEEIERFKLPLYSLTRKDSACDAWPEGRFIEVSRPAVLSTVKASEDGRAIVVRVSNPTEKATQVTVRPFFEFTAASLADMEEVPQKKRGGPGRRIRVRLGGKEVATLRFELP